MAPLYDHIQWGYVCGHFEDVKINSPDCSLSIQRTKGKAWRQSPMACYRHMGIRQVDWDKPLLIPFFPDNTSIYNQIVASVHRYGCDMPVPQMDRIDHFREYAKLIITSYFVPVRDEDIVDWDLWLHTRGYPAGRREALRVLWKEMVAMPNDVLGVKGHIKVEGYDEPKNARAILSYSDSSKVILGPLINAIDHCTFGSLPNFVKGSDPKTWPQRLQGLFGSKPVNCTDFSSFEAHHRGTYAYIVYFWMAHMLRGVTGRKRMREIIKAMVLGRNEIRFRDIKVSVDQRLMSGALWTSSSNGVLNLLLMSYMTLVTKFGQVDPRVLCGHFRTDFTGLCEGDDGICEYVPINPRMMDELGIKLKMTKAQSYDMAGFCQIYCMSDQALRDPIKTLTKFFVLPVNFVGSKRSRVLSYLRAKAESYKYLYPDAPVVGPLMDWVLDRTRSIDSRQCVDLLGYWDKYVHSFVQQFRRTRAKPSDAARSRVEVLFGLSITKQLEIEDVLHRSNCDVIDLDLSQFAKSYHYKAVREFVVPRDCMTLPSEPNVPRSIREIERNGLSPSRKSKVVGTQHPKFWKGGKDLSSSVR